MLAPGSNRDGPSEEQDAPGTDQSAALKKSSNGPTNSDTAIQAPQLSSLQTAQHLLKARFAQPAAKLCVQRDWTLLTLSVAHLAAFAAYAAIRVHYLVAGLSAKLPWVNVPYSWFVLLAEVCTTFTQCLRKANSSRMDVSFCHNGEPYKKYKPAENHAEVRIWCSV